MKLYHGTLSQKSQYNNNGLDIVEYGENKDGDLLFQILDEKGLDPVGDGFSFEEAVEFINNCNPYFYSYHSGFRVL